MNVEMWHRVRKHGVRGFKHGACGYYYRDNFTCEDFYGDWKSVRLGECRIGRVYDWKSVRLKECEIERVQDWKSARLEDCVNV